MTFDKQQKHIKVALSKFTRDKWLLNELSQIISIKIHTSKFEKLTKGLIYFITKSVYIDHYRKVKSKKNESVVYEHHDGESDYKPDVLLINKENKSILLTCVDNLPEKQKEVVYLRYYSNLNYLQISKIMKCPKNTALSYMHDAKRNLKILLTKTNNYEN
jgi:RNA polymerase sigma-70 factor (ECF subfamily)